MGTLSLHLPTIISQSKLRGQAHSKGWESALCQRRGHGNGMDSSRGEKLGSVIPLTTDGNGHFWGSVGIWTLC